MRTITRSSRTVATVSLTAALGLGLAACQDDVSAGGSSSSAAGVSASATASSPASSAQSTAASPSQSASASDATPSAGSSAPSAAGADTTATGQLSKVTFSLPAGFKVFDRAELTNDADLAELSKITGVPAQQLRPASPAMDLNAVSLAKEDGGTSNILLFGASDVTSVPDEAKAKELNAKTGSAWVGYRTASTPLGKAALVESNDPVATGGTVTHVDVFLPSHDGASAQLTITARTSKRANEIADVVTSSIRAAR